MKSGIRSSTWKIKGLRYSFPSLNFYTVVLEADCSYVKDKNAFVGNSTLNYTRLSDTIYVYWNKEGNMFV